MRANLNGYNANAGSTSQLQFDGSVLGSANQYNFSSVGNLSPMPMVQLH